MPIYIRVTPQHDDQAGGGVFEYEFDQDEVLIGRSEAVDLRLPHKAVSLVHGRLLREHDRLFYTDLDSTNGTTIDGRPTAGGRSRPVDVGSRLLIGPFTVQLVSPSDLAGRDGDRDTSSYARQMVVDLLQALGGESIPTLEWISGPDRGRRQSLSDGPIMTIGRAEECDLQLNDSDASRKHAELRSGPRGVTIADLGSKNGVRVNGERIATPRTLCDGDRIRIGATDLRFVDPAAEVLAGLQQEGDEVSAPRASAKSHAVSSDRHPSRSGEMRSLKPSDEPLSPASVREIGEAESVVSQSQVAGDGPASLPTRQHVDIVLMIVGGALVAGAAALIIYLMTT